jgi:uncharacterized membrane protein YcgQ (UPF0703/DUF1980 family)
MDLLSFERNARQSISIVLNIDGFAKSRFYPVFVIPAKAGIQLNQAVLDSRLRGSDGFFDFLRDHQYWSLTEREAISFHLAYILLFLNNSMLKVSPVLADKQFTKGGCLWQRFRSQRILRVWQK